MYPTLQLDVATADGRTKSFTFDAFPIRIGRDELADCELAFPFVSRHHATIDWRDESLILRDEGSRNGVYVRGTKLEPGERVDLGAVGYEFEIMTLHIRATVRENFSTATVFDVTPDAENATHHYEDASINPKIVDAHAILLQVRASYDRYREAWEEIQRSLAASVETLPPDRRAVIVRHLAIEFAQLAREPEFRALANRYGVDLGIDAPSAGPSAADVALRGVRELAAAYVPYAPPLASKEAVAAFIERLESALDVMFEGFVALRFAHRSETQQPVELQISPDELAARLLDWTATGRSARDEVEDAFVEMLTHHAQLIADVGAGARKLLTELSPDAIEASVPQGFWSIGRSKRLWNALRYRYARLTSAEIPALGNAFVLAQSALAAQPSFEAPSGAEEHLPALLPSAVPA